MKPRPRHIAAALALGTAAGLILLLRGTDPVSPELGAAWRSAVAALEQSDSQGAKEAFTEWIRRAQARGIRSSGAHFNLGMAHWALKEPGPAVEQFLRAARLSVSPGDLWRLHEVLAGTQRELGVSDATTRDGAFRLFLWVPENYALALICAGFWLLFAVFLFWWPRRREWRHLTVAALALLPMGLIALGGLAELNRWRGTYAVLDNASGVVGLFPDPRPEPQEKLLDLPSGTLVFSSGEIRNGMAKVESPIVAWVPADSLRSPR